MTVDRDRTRGRNTPELLQAVMAMAANLDLPSVLTQFVKASADLTGAPYAAINVLDSRGRSTTFVQTGVESAIAKLIAHPPHAQGVLGQIPAHGVLLLEDLTQHPAFRGFPKGHPPMGSFLGASVRVRDIVFGHLYLADKPGGFDADDADIVTALAAAAAIAIENAQLYTDARRRQRWLRAGQDISTMLLSGADEEDALATIAATAREVAGADTAALVLPGLGDQWVMEIVDGAGAEDLLGTVMPPDGRSMTALRDGNGLVVDNLSATRVLRVPAMRRFGSALYAPMLASGRGIGVLVLMRDIGTQPFAQSDLVTAESFAAQAGLALVLAEARHAHDVAALLDERERIARDLHDLAIQQLFATGMQLETVRRRAARGVDATELTSIVEDALDNVDSTVRQIRSIVHALRDPDADVHLVERLRREASLARTGLGFAPSLVISVDGRVLDSEQSLPEDDDAVSNRVDDDLSDDVVAVVREGLANAARHAQAASVAVRVGVTGEGPTGLVSIEVEDDGAGLAEDRERRSGTDNLATRARRHGGTFSLGSSPSGRGTLLVWEVPLA